MVHYKEEGIGRKRPTRGLEQPQRLFSQENLPGILQKGGDGTNFSDPWP